MIRIPVLARSGPPIHDHYPLLCMFRVVNVKVAPFSWAPSATVNPAHVSSSLPSVKPKIVTKMPGRNATKTPGRNATIDASGALSSPSGRSVASSGSGKDDFQVCLQKDWEICAVHGEFGLWFSTGEMSFSRRKGFWHVASSWGHFVQERLSLIDWLAWLYVRFLTATEKN